MQQSVRISGNVFVHFVDKIRYLEETRFPHCVAVGLLSRNVPACKQLHQTQTSLWVLCLFRFHGPVMHGGVGAQTQRTFAEELRPLDSLVFLVG